MINRLIDLGVTSPVVAAPREQEQEGLREAFDTHARLQMLVAKVDLTLSMLQPYKKRFRDTTSNEQQKKYQEEVDRIYKLLKADLVVLDQELNELKDGMYRALDLEEADQEALEISIAAFYKVYEELLQKSQLTYSELQKISREQLVRKVRMLDNDLPPQQIEEMVDSNPMAFQELITRKTMGGISNDMKNQARDIMEKCENIKKLQQNVKELIEMLKTISKIVAAQGNKVNSVAEHVKSAKDYVASTNKHLLKAKGYHSDFRCVS